MLNDFNKLSSSYVESDEKPDKKYSMLPTILNIAGDLHGKTVLDLGCGTGYFTKEFSKTAKSVIGLDNSQEQLNLATATKTDNAIYQFADIFSEKLPKSDIMNAPFVLGYLNNQLELDGFFLKVFKSLNNGGKFISVIDYVSDKDLTKYGAKKEFCNVDYRKKIKISLFNDNKKLCELFVTAFSKVEIETSLVKAGFRNITWHKPIISKEGIETLSKEFWNDYINDCQLYYLSAEK